MIEQVAQQSGFVAQIAQKLPPDAGHLVIMNSDQLKAAQTGVRVIKAMSYFLAILVVALYALAVYLVGPGRRRRMIMSVGFAILLVGIILLVVRRFAGNWVVDSLNKNPDFDAATAAVWSIGTHLLRNVAINFVVYGVVVAVGAWMAGPSRPATAVRRWLAPTFREHPVIVYSVVTLGLLIFLATGPTDSSRLIPLLVLFAFVYIGVEILRRQTAREFPAPAGQPT
jgi:drug/metabolite transporter (DMT)-like permease